MADLKISQLPSATTPLAGTEALPIVQSSATKQVSIANLTAGRSVSVADATLTSGNLVIGTSGKGIDFSATGQAGGMTGELLNDYEEGTWTPTDASGAGLTFTDTSNNCFYTKVGRVVTACFSLAYPSTADSNFARIGGLPFNSMSTTDNPHGGYFTEQGFSAGASISLTANGNSFIILTTGTVSIATNANLSTKILRGVVMYQV